MEVVEPSLVADRDNGASLASEHGEPAPVETLPMVVWLRGDEPMADEFVIDAEGAMEVLGIKRSRLTQISGKELRVGRIRIDRYTRPVYRQRDLLEYKSWTRATATHARASAAIDAAAKNLESQGSALADRFDAALAKATEQLETSLQSQAEGSNKLHQESLETLQWSIHTSQHVLTQLQNSHQSALEERFHRLDTEFTELKSFKQEFDKTQIALTHLINLTTEAIASGKSGQQTQQNFNRDVGKALSLIIEYQRESDKAQERLLGQLIQDIQAVAKKIELPHRQAPATKRRQRTAPTKQRLRLLLARR